MGRGTLTIVFALATALAGCGSFDGMVPPDSNREVLGVNVDQPGASDNTAISADAKSKVDWKISQICTLGPAPIREDVEPAESDRQFVDQQLHCNPYRFNVLGVSFAGLVPSWPPGY